VEEEASATNGTNRSAEELRRGTGPIAALKFILNCVPTHVTAHMLRPHREHFAQTAFIAGCR
jgi:hypothetical protein